MERLEMSKKWLYTVILLLVNTIGLSAQEYIEKADTVTIQPKPVAPVTPSLFNDVWQPHFLFPEVEAVESKEQRAARINQEIYDRVMASVNHNLSWHRPPALSNTEKALLLVAGFFLNSPYKFKPGTVPLMNASNPFVYAVTPGCAPIFHPYNTDAFPQCIRTEFDFKSGTYQQVMVQWNEVEKSMARSFGGPYRYEPVPRMQFSSDRMMLP